MIVDSDNRPNLRDRRRKTVGSLSIGAKIQVLMPRKRHMDAALRHGQILCG